MQGERKSILFQLVFLVCVSRCMVIWSYAALPEDDHHPEIESETEMVRLELIHRHDVLKLLDLEGTLTVRPKTQLERIRDLYQKDITRFRRISISISQRKRPLNTTTVSQTKRRRRNDLEIKTAANIEIPIHSGADYGNGQYFVHVKVGTPAQKFMLVADTGSELTWINCRYRCGHNNNCDLRRRRRRKVFLADRSSSFKTVPCLSRMCKMELINLFSLTRCPTAFTPCAYDYSYMDGSAAKGLFANETITVGLTNGRKAKLTGALIGCTETARGESFTGADGVLGLGYGKYSFTQKAADNFGGTFSYCLVDHLSPKNVSNYLIFGRGTRKQSAVKPPLSSNLRYTKLEVGGVISPFYGVNILSISIGGVMLKVPFKVWDMNLGGGTILDSGTSLTFLTMPAYTPLITTLTMSLSKFQRLTLTPFEYCFNSTGFKENMLPKLRFHFADGAVFEPPVKSYVIDTAPQTKCLGFMPIDWPATSIIGNIMQQNHVWEFDLVRRTVGFAPSTCRI